MLNLTFLGTAASVPSRDRTMSCIGIRQDRAVTLFDCAEGSQRQLMISKLSFMKIDDIFITHLHGDHVYGLPGLLQTMGMTGRKNPLRVFGPKGIAHCLEVMMSVCEGTLEYDLTVTELEAGDSVRLPKATVTAFETSHGIPSLGYLYVEDDGPGHFDKAKALELGLKPGPEFSRLQAGETVNGVAPEQIIGPPKRGMRIAYTGDTVPVPAIAQVSEGADVLIHESTYGPAENELAQQHFHSTCTDAAEAARKAGVRMLMLTHVSNRYDDLTELENCAREIFENTVAVRDLDSFDVSANSITQV